MKNLNPRLVQLLAALAAILAAAVLIVLGLKYRAARNLPDNASGLSGAAGNQTAYSAISYWNGNTVQSFAVNESGIWTWVDDPEFPLDPTDITALAETLTTLTPQQTITEPKTLDHYGLDEPTATLDALAPDGGKLSLTFGKATTDGKSVYLLMDGAESPVYILDGALLTQMNRGVYDMMALPALPALTEENVQSVVLSAGELTTTLTAVRELDQEGKPLPKTPVFWKINDQDANGKADGVLSELGELCITQCVDFKPSAHAVSLCGFDTPAAKILVTYRTESGTEQTLTLTFGKSTGTGRYLRINEDSTIYLIATELVDSLLPAAVKGFA
ncbi:MAG: DUF4340 domain-containing protein [Oscillibacter sp.]